ncbi:hypothetical protein DB32_008063 [Sandaracinus amylolyticus]|uniref:Uncharacterized protein n=1 Tax=Sandaracinus amylolyticus TaxID=927083 RepID=A0A0F6SHR7_9BACT|nr:hypothetical protein DB32_008063 [Sandaracinus amylolyticus]
MRREGRENHDRNEHPTATHHDSSRSRDDSPLERPSEGIGRTEASRPLARRCRSRPIGGRIDVGPTRAT